MTAVRVWIGLVLAATVISSTTTGTAEGTTHPCAGAPAAPFVDVKRRSKHAKAIDCAYWYRAMRDRGGVDRFRPRQAVRRDLAATTVFRVLAGTERGLPRPGWVFDDLDGNRHRRRIERLAAAGVVDIPRSRLFHPEWKLNRAKAAVYVLRAYRYATRSERESAPDAFEDDDGHRYEAAINEAAALGLVTGRTATGFAPDERISRAELASFTAGLIRRLGADGELELRTRRYEARVRRLPKGTRNLMRDRSWEPGCPVPMKDLRALELVHRGMRGGRRWGVLVVHRDVADELVGAFRDIYRDRFRIRKMRLVDRYGADDGRSMAADNTSAFNCRYISGTTRWSLHAYGLAVDINPVRNPYVDGSIVEPEAGRDYLDRDDVRHGMIVRPGPVLDAFGSIGWGWGGDWSSVKDYQHLSSTGR